MENRTTIESNVEHAMEYVHQHYHTVAIEHDFPKRIIVPVDVAVIRHYRTYIECYDGTDESCIMHKALKQIVEEQDNVLIPDPDLDIEENDVNYLHVDFDGIQRD